MTEFMKACAAEAIGTFALVFIGAGTICVNEYTGRGMGWLGVAVAHAAVLALAVTVTYPISGGHLNPAVTFGFWLTGRMDRDRAWRYGVFQLVGAATAGFFLRWIFSEHVWRSVGLGAPILAADVSTGRGIFVEGLLTFLLALAYWGTLFDERPARIGGLGVGLAMAAAILMGGPLTGAALNPARAFGPAVASGHWDSHLVYWIGPLIGGGAAAVLYSSRALPKR